jgi:hypothetical protein
MRTLPFGNISVKGNSQTLPAMNAFHHFVFRATKKLRKQAERRDTTRNKRQSSAAFP